MSAPIPVGSRVVLVEDNSVALGGADCGRKGWRGITESDLNSGDYRIRFDNGNNWWVRASAVALESPAPDPDALTTWERDTALAMAIRLAGLMQNAGDDGSYGDDGPCDTRSSTACYLCTARWLRDCVAQELEGQ